MTRLFYLIALVLIPISALAQQPIVRPATSEDFTGYWRLLPFPEERQPKELPENPWPGTCQYFVHAPTKVWLQFADRDAYGKDLTGERCNRSAKALEETFSMAPKNATWAYNNGHVLIEIPQAKIGEVWKVDYFTAGLPLPNRFGIELQPGDLIMQMVDLKKRVVLWVRLLRRAS